MSVEIDTEHATLAGSTGINSAIHEESDAEALLNDPGANAGQDGTPKRRGRGPAKPKPGVLVLLCARCSHVIAGSGAGYAYVSLVDAQKTAQRAAAGYIDPAKARWTLAHRRCAPEPLAPMSPYFRLWADRIGTTDDLLDAMVTLSRQLWFAWSDWGALARGILADTETASVQTSRAQRVAARAEGLPDDDPRHGTCVGYDHWCCRCERCRAAASHKRREQRATRQGIER